VQVANLPIKPKEKEERIIAFFTALNLTCKNLEKRGIAPI
jgi:hypothetical protein